MELSESFAQGFLNKKPNYVNACLGQYKLSLYRAFTLSRRTRIKFSKSFGRMCIRFELASRWGSLELEWANIDSKRDFAFTGSHPSGR